jgi:hypothetical protein
MYRLKFQSLKPLPFDILTAGKRSQDNTRRCSRRTRDLEPRCVQGRRQGYHFSLTEPKRRRRWQPDSQALLGFFPEIQIGGGMVDEQVAGCFAISSTCLVLAVCQCLDTQRHPPGLLAVCTVYVHKSFRSTMTIIGNGLVRAYWSLD